MLVPVEGTEQVVQVGEPDVHVAVGVVRDRMLDQHGLDVVPGRRQQLHDALGADGRDDLVVVAGLHPGERPREARVDAVVGRPVVERAAHRARVRRGDGGCRALRGRRRDSKLDADQQRLRRIELVHLRDLRQRRLVLSRDRREGVAGLDGVAAQRKRERRPHRHSRLQPERRERRGAGDTVRFQVHHALVAAHSRNRGLVHVRVHRHRHAALVQEELQHGDVPPELAAGERSRSEERCTERAELTARPEVGDPGHVEPVRLLKLANGSDRLRPDDRVDRPQIEALSPQRHLEPCVLRIEGCAHRRGCDQTHGEHPRQFQPEAHGPLKYRAPAGIPPPRAVGFGCFEREPGS